jgi:hypothetical protein
MLVLMKTGVLTSLRLLFAFLSANERKRDFSSTRKRHSFCATESERAPARAAR